MIACKAQPDNPQVWWSWRTIDGRQCWYEGRPGKAKGELFWPSPDPPSTPIVLAHQQAPAPQDPPILDLFPSERWPLVSLPTAALPATTAQAQVEAPPRFTALDVTVTGLLFTLFLIALLKGVQWLLAEVDA